MGLESYLFNVIFQEKVKNEEILPIFRRVGVTFLEDYESIWNQIPDVKGLFFEIRTRKGLTQIHVLLDKKEGFVRDFTVRFSVVSPSTVIEQTFELFERLNNEAPIILRDSEIINHLWRKDVKAGNRDNSFESMRTRHEEDEIYEIAAVIPINVDLFKKNEMRIAKRRIILENETGAIVGGGSDTFDYLEKTDTNVVEKLVNIIKEEL
jgi:hypothetical protein